MPTEEDLPTHAVTHIREDESEEEQVQERESSKPERTHWRKQPLSIETLIGILTTLIIPAIVTSVWWASGTNQRITDIAEAQKEMKADMKAQMTLNREEIMKAIEREHQETREDNKRLSGGFDSVRSGIDNLQGQVQSLNYALHHVNKPEN